MKKISKALRARNEQIKAQFIQELRKTQSPKEDKRSIMQIYTSLAVDYDLSIERIRKIVNSPQK